MLAPASAWTTRKALCLALALPVCFICGAAVAVRMLPPADGRLNDFVQEWTSGRDYWAGQSIYRDLEQSTFEHLGRPLGATVPLHFNAHPPVSVLLALPLARLEFFTAWTVWNIVSLAALAVSLALILGRWGLGWRVWAWLPVVAVLLCGSPLAQQVAQGQLNLLLLVLVTAAWVADRRERPALAGALVGLAAAVKLFPAFVFVYFLARRRWSAIASGAVVVIGLHAAALGLFGWGDFVRYGTVVMPTVSQVFRGDWPNQSLVGFACKLFESANPGVVPLLASPLLAWTAIVALGLALATALGRQAARATSLAQRDHAFAACVVGMVLLSPVAWNHYFVMLVLPVLVFWQHSSGRAAGRAALVAAIVLLTISPRWITAPVLSIHDVAQPVHVMTVLSVGFYGLVLLLVAGARSWPGHGAASTATEPAAVAALLESIRHRGPAIDLAAPMGMSRRAELRLPSHGVKPPARQGSLVLVAALHTIVISAGASWAACRYVAVSRETTALPALRNEPRVVAPRYDEPLVVSDEQLRGVLSKLAPCFREAPPPVSTVDHALRFWGAQARFADPQALSGEEMRQYLVDHQQFVAHGGSRDKPLLVDDGRAVHFRTFDGAGSSSHTDHTLACLLEVGTPLDYPLRTPRRETTLRVVMEQALRDFSLNQAEYEWSALAFALAFERPTSWFTKDGQRVTFDDLAERIMRQRLPQGVCRAGHRLHTLAILLRIDEAEPLFSPGGRRRVVEFLRQIAALLVRTQSPEGFWDGNWPELPGHVSPEKTSREEALQERLLVTGHLLECWALAPPEVLPPRENIIRAAQWTVKAIDELSPQTVTKRYGPLSHAGRALALWRGKWPHEVPLGPAK